MSLDAPEIVVVDALDAAVSGLTKGTNLFAGPLRPGKALACFCRSTGGFVPSLLQGGGQIEMQTVQVAVWSPRDQYQAGLTTARAALRAIHRTIQGGYYHVEVREADPASIGIDDDGRHGFAFNVELHGHRE